MRSLILASIARPLKIVELVEALRLNPDERSNPMNTEPQLDDPDEILALLPSLVTVYDETDYDIESTYHIRKIQLAYFSVREFLLADETLKRKPTPLLPSVDLNQDFLTRSCLHYILAYEKSEAKLGSTEDLSTYPLLEYACRYWPVHQEGIVDLRDMFVIFWISRCSWDEHTD